MKQKYLIFKFFEKNSVLSDFQIYQICDILKQPFWNIFCSRIFFLFLIHFDNFLPFCINFFFFFGGGIFFGFLVVLLDLIKDLFENYLGYYKKLKRLLLNTKNCLEWSKTA